MNFIACVISVHSYKSKSFESQIINQPFKIKNCISRGTVSKISPKTLTPENFSRLQEAAMKSSCPSMYRVPFLPPNSSEHD